MRRSSGLLAALLALGSVGCGAVTVVERPPSARDIATINEAVRQGRGLVVEAPVALLGPADASAPGGPPALPLGPCAAGFCAQRAPRPVRETARSIVSADERAITFATKRGTQVTLPLELVAGVKVTAADRASGAGLGALVGVGVDVAFGAALLALSNLKLGDPDPSAPKPAGCQSGCVTALALGALVPVIVGAVVGHSIGVPRRYRFAATPRPVPEDIEEESPATP